MSEGDQTPPIFAIDMDNPTEHVRAKPSPPNGASTRALVNQETKTITCKKCDLVFPENTYRCTSCGEQLHAIQRVQIKGMSEEDALSSFFPKQNIYSFLGYYCGVFSFTPVMGVILTPFAIVLGSMGIYRFKTNKNAKGILHSIGGVALGTGSILAHAVLLYIALHIDWDTYRFLFG